jgi:hypothetical protein
MKTAALLLSTILLFITSCSKPSHESIANEMLDTMKQMSDAVLGTKDVASAKVAAEKIKKAGERFDEIAAKLKKMDPPSEAVRADIEKKMEEKSKEMMGEQSAKVMQALDAESLGIVQNAMKDAFSKMSAHSEEFDRHFKAPKK